VFKVQDEISTAIATALEAKLSGRPVSAAAVRTVNPAAYDDYLQGRAFFARRAGNNLKLAVEAFDRAIAHDPSYSMAHSGRAFALAISTGWTPWLPIKTASAEALISANEALRLDPENAEAYLVRGVLKTSAFEEVEGRADLDRARALAPGSVDVMNFLGDELMYTADLRGAERLKRQAMALDPLFFVHPANLANVMRAQGRFRDGLAMANRSASLGGADFANGEVFFNQLRLGDLDAARQTLATLCAEASAGSRPCLIVEAALSAASGGDVAPILARIDARVASGADVGAPLVDLISLYANELGDIPKATALLREAIQGTDFSTEQALLLGPKGARLPEEVSKDPDWLAAWNDPKLRETMAAYRKNLLAYRKGG
jgi:Flp pilus assembly protein TadD